LLQVIYEGGSGAFFTDAETILLQDAAGQTRSGFKLNAVAGGLELQLTDDADYLVNSSNQDLVKAGAGDDIVWATGRDVAVPSDAPAPRRAVTEVMPSVQGGAGDDILLAGQAGQGVRQGVDAGTQLTSVANIEGGSGDDTLVAVSGTVYATGNTGRDSFALFSDSRNVQLVIKDFNATTDVIDLSALVRNASGALSSDQLAQRKADLLLEVLSSLEGQTQTQALELNVSKWLDPLSEATVAKISVEFANSPEVSTVLTSHNFVLDPPSWRDLDPLVNNAA
jgi:Ca2+-binding RTX toxin-like protein